MMLWYAEAASVGDMGIAVGAKIVWVLFGEGVSGEVRLFRRQTERFDDEAALCFCCCNHGRLITMVVGLTNCRGADCCGIVGLVTSRGIASLKVGSVSCPDACGDGSGGRIGVVGDGGIILKEFSRRGCQYVKCADQAVGNHALVMKAVKKKWQMEAHRSRRTLEEKETEI